LRRRLVAFFLAALFLDIFFWLPSSLGFFLVQLETSNHGDFGLRRIVAEP
jgi:hypothetical protein